MTTTKIETMDRDASKVLSALITKALTPALDELGLRMRLKSSVYDPRAGTYKPSFIISLRTINGENAEAVRFKKSAAALGVSRDALGRKFKDKGGVEYVVTGLRDRAPKRPLIARRLSDGSEFVFTVTALGRECPNCKVRGGCSCRDSEKVMARGAEATRVQFHASTQKVLDDTERRLIIKALGGRYHVINADRGSDREYDVTFTYIELNDLNVEVGRGSAWLPLYAIRELAKWTGHAVAMMTDYPGMTRSGDWSGVRDSERDTIWAIFQKHVLHTA